MSSEGYKLYWDYSIWSTSNNHILEFLPAYQDLNNQRFVSGITKTRRKSHSSFTIERSSEDKKVAQMTDEEFLDSKTQARAFMLICEKCKRVFTSKKRLENHLERCCLKKDEINRFTCKECFKNFEKNAGLMKHAAKYHDKNIEEEQILAVSPVPGEALTTENITRKPKQQLKAPSPSIFHSISLLARSDCV